jgi:hypothetical protein
MSATWPHNNKPWLLWSIFWGPTSHLKSQCIWFILTRYLVGPTARAPANLKVSLRFHSSPRECRGINLYCSRTWSHPLLLLISSVRHHTRKLISWNSTYDLKFSRRWKFRLWSSRLRYHVCCMITDIVGETSAFIFWVSTSEMLMCLMWLPTSWVNLLPSSPGLLLVHRVVWCVVTSILHEPSAFISWVTTRTSCSLMCGYQHLAWTFCLHILGYYIV